MKKNKWLIYCFATFLILLYSTPISIGIEINNHDLFDFPNKGFILYVGGSGPGNFSNIQDAIDNASQGNIVFVYNGTYIENVLINKSIDLIGEKRENTIIDGGNIDHVVNIVADNVSIKNFYINNSRLFGEHAGIKIYDERKNITIDNNIIFDNYVGISVGQADYYKRIHFVNITNNLILKNKYGILLFEGRNSRIINNTFFNCGIFISTGSPRENIVEENTINGLPLIYFEDQSNKIVQPNAGQVILVNCDNVTVSSQTLNFKCRVGIELLRCSNCNVTNNNISKKFFAIYSLYSESNNIQANIIENNSRAIKIDQSDKHTISFNKINDTRYSVEIDEASQNTISFNNLINGVIAFDLYRSSDNIFFKNDIENFQYSGLNLYYECHRNQIQNNTINNCSQEGIIIYGTKRIWWDSACVKNVISGNEIKKSRIGIVLEESAITKVFSNNIIQNKIGIEIRSARYNKVFNNNIFENDEEDAILMNSFSSRFNSNFWNETKRIHTIKGGFYYWNYWTYEFYEILYLPRFDWHAVKEPYEIGE